MPSPLTGRSALVTGASSGIGHATALALSAAGAAVTVLARREDRLRDLAREIAARGGDVLVVAADVRDRDAVVAAAAAHRERWGPADVLVNNAGVMPVSPIAELRVDDWDRMIDVNLKGLLYTLAAVLPDMLAEGRGHIVNVGSVAGRRPFPGGAVYSATKFAVRALTAGIQLELSAARGIRVTDVQPGVVDTELQDHAPDPERLEAFRAAWSERRMLEPEDVADAVLFAVTAPARMNVNEILVRPTDQPT